MDDSSYVTCVEKGWSLNYQYMYVSGIVFIVMYCKYVNMCKINISNSKYPINWLVGSVNKVNLTRHHRINYKFLEVEFLVKNIIKYIRRLLKIITKVKILEAQRLQNQVRMPNFKFKFKLTKRSYLE
jgi:hypothetical protein